jgi:hypothetical protein
VDEHGRQARLQVHDVDRPAPAGHLQDAPGHSNANSAVATIDGVKSLIVDDPRRHGSVPRRYPRVGLRRYRCGRGQP